MPCVPLLHAHSEGVAAGHPLCGFHFVRVRPDSGVVHASSLSRLDCIHLAAADATSFYP